MTIYIAGPMTGIPQWNFPAFDAAAERLRRVGHIAVNPADFDREAGFDPAAHEVTKEFLAAALRRDIDAVFAADGVAVLPGWHRSVGARVEVLLAVRLGKPIIDAESLEDITQDIVEVIRCRV